MLVLMVIFFVRRGPVKIHILRITQKGIYEVAVLLEAPKLGRREKTPTPKTRFSI